MVKDTSGVIQTPPINPLMFIHNVSVYLYSCIRHGIWKIFVLFDVQDQIQTERSTWNKTVGFYIIVPENL